MATRKTILGAKLDEKFHQPPENIQWWEFDKGEGPPHLSPGDIPGLLPTYGTREGESIHNLIEEMPEIREEILVSRRQGRSSSPWTIAQFIQIQYGLWKRDNINRARIRQAMLNRISISTEDDADSRGIIMRIDQQAILDDPYIAPVDGPTVVYGHWVSAYGEPKLSISECGVSLCRDAQSVDKLVRTETEGVYQQLMGTLAPFARPPAEYRYNAVENITRDEFGNNIGESISGSAGTFDSAKSTVEGFCNSYAGAMAAFCSTRNAEETAAGRPLRYSPAGIWYGTPQKRVVTVAENAAVAAGTYETDDYVLQVINLVFTRNDYPGEFFEYVSGSAYGSGIASYPAPVPSNAYVPGTNYNVPVPLGVEDYYLGVKAVEVRVSPRLTHALSLRPPDAEFNPAIQPILKARKITSAGVVAFQTGASEVAFECLAPISWPVGVDSPCSAPEGNIPINPATGEMCNVPFYAEESAFPEAEFGTFWPPTTVVMPESNFFLRDGSEEPLYPTFYGAYVYDIHLKKWGKYKGQNKQLLDYQPINQAMNGLQSYAKFGILGGILDPVGSVRLFGFTPVESSIVYGKIGYYRQGMTTVEEALVHMRVPCTGVLNIRTSLNGKVENTDLIRSFPYSGEVSIRATGGFSGRWHNIELTGQFDLSYMEFRGIIQGKR